MKHTTQRMTIAICFYFFKENVQNGERFSNDDGDGNENGKKAIGLDWQSRPLHVLHDFLYLSLPSSHDYQVKLPIVTFCGGL